jgi:hypothetical protein
MFQHDGAALAPSATHVPSCFLSYGLTQQIHAFAPCRFTPPTSLHHPQLHIAGCPVRGPFHTCGELVQSVYVPGLP